MKIDASSLERMSPQQLAPLVIRFDTQLKERKREADSLHQENQALNKQLAATQEEIQLYKKHSEDLEVSFKQFAEQLEESKTLLDCRNFEIRTLKELNDHMREKTNSDF